MNELTDPLQFWMTDGHYARVDEVELFYRISGRSSSDLPWLLCFHGFRVAAYTKQ